MPTLSANWSETAAEYSLIAIWMLGTKWSEPFTLLAAECEDRQAPVTMAGVGSWLTNDLRRMN